MPAPPNASRASRGGALHRFRAWIVLGALYAGFFLWYTPLGGPLSEEEIAHYEDALRELVRSDEAFARFQAFMRSDTGDDFAMFNAIAFRDRPTPTEGLEPGASARDALRRYGEPFFRLAAPKATHPVMIGAAAAGALDLWGIDGAEHWDQGALVRYRSRRDLMNQVVALAERARDGEDIHRFKIAALEKTIAYPLDPWFQLGDPRLVLGLLVVAIGLGLDVRRLSRAVAADHPRSVS